METQQAAGYLTLAKIKNYIYKKTTFYIETEELYGRLYIRNAL